MRERDEQRVVELERLGPRRAERPQRRLDAVRLELRPRPRDADADPQPARVVVGATLQQAEGLVELLRGRGELADLVVGARSIEQPPRRLQRVALDGSSSRGRWPV
ncbi:hypothetical protein KMZ32_05725 [Phycicoccus sp. MAQZ13P-2]|uniref:hypothetical protein n=1 Tax=Phycicoccus mangrovi TaxID=2840470 RepID=UPI001C00467C|nr:hypothetical protein [Phycicoccus mangrovi]MBT9255344.1 hypothetical protein [Phycicoccus mangrovi]MBT9273575.1 hypothetical protein [Phycicoccus mangrovi]